MMREGFRKVSGCFGIFGAGETGCDNGVGAGVRNCGRSATVSTVRGQIEEAGEFVSFGSEFNLHPARASVAGRNLQGGSTIARGTAMPGEAEGKDEWNSDRDANVHPRSLGGD